MNAPSGDPIRVVIIDDDALVRAALAMILRDDAAIALVGDADDRESGLELVARAALDVVLMDIRMPRMGGIEALARLMAQPAPPKVVVLTTFDDETTYCGRCAAEPAASSSNTPHQRRSLKRCTRLPRTTPRSRPAWPSSSSPGWVTTSPNPSGFAMRSRWPKP